MPLLLLYEGVTFVPKPYTQRNPPTTRSLSYEGVTFDTVNVDIDDKFRDLYGELAAWARHTGL